MRYDMDWLDNAKCAHDPVVQEEIASGYDRFHDEREDTQAKQIVPYCLDCPVRRDCFEFAMWIEYDKRPAENDNMFRAVGVWGGTTIRQRARFHHVRVERREKTLALLAQLTGQPQPSSIHNEDSEDVPA